MTNVTVRAHSANEEADHVISEKARCVILSEAKNLDCYAYLFQQPVGTELWLCPKPRKDDPTLGISRNLKVCPKEGVSGFALLE